MKDKSREILVITDNIYLLEKFIEIIREPEFHEYNFIFGISKQSNLIDFQKFNQDVFEIDLKNDSVIDSIIERYKMVFSLHCKQLFPKKLTDNLKCINIHPGYNPINRGWFPQVFSIIHGTPIGATIHEITEELDNGPIIVREFVKSEIEDTSEKLYTRVLDKEIELLKSSLLSILEGKYTTFIDEHSPNNLYLKSDFNELKTIELEEKVSFKKALDFLRAMTFEKYDNAYFIDPETGDQIFVKISLKRVKRTH